MKAFEGTYNGRTIRARVDRRGQMRISDESGETRVLSPVAAKTVATDLATLDMARHYCSLIASNVAAFDMARQFVALHGGKIPAGLGRIVEGARYDVLFRALQAGTGSRRFAAVS